MLSASQIKGVDAVSIASILHYGYLKSHQPKHNEEAKEGNIEFLKNARYSDRYHLSDIIGIKELLNENGVSIRS